MGSRPLGSAPFATLPVVAEATGRSLQVAPPGGSPGDAVALESGLADVASVDEAIPRTLFDVGRRRFTFATLIAMGVTAVPFIWILWSEWGSPTLFRQAVYEDNFFDLQTRAMFHGHLSLPNGALGLEGFVHDGRTYTYFGLFGSIIRMPILLITSSLDGKLTTLSILVAWLLTGLFVALLLWKVRFLLRGDAAMGRVEATGYGILMATIMGGSVWMVLAAIPYVFGEDIAWSICLTVGSILALLGVIERPSWGRVIASGVLILCASLDRATTGWACVLAAAFIAVWFFLGLGGPENRRWWIPVLLAGVIPLVIGCAVNYAKFGVPFNVPITEQVWSQVNGYRKRFSGGQPQLRGWHGLHTNGPPHLPSPRQLELQQCVPVHHAAHEPTDRGWRRALRQAVPDLKRSSVDAAPLPPQSLGSRNCLSTQSSRKGGADPTPASGGRGRRRRLALVGIHRTEVPR